MAACLGCSRLGNTPEAIGDALCLPQLGIKVRYTPGTCAILRGDALEHLTEDYSGERYFIIGTNYESTKKSAWRRLGHPPSYGRRDRGRACRDPENLCINEEHNEEDLKWMNSELHGAGALSFTGDSKSSAS
ncbi:hypothetical protein F5Y19DRAFT_23556 [Xylariaceae sp. FL1651]|nr:hypothetical protein F5Y19DRAFT_23556 [Xylariaceae sp. FL1651]